MRAARVDDNQSAIVKALRKAGMIVQLLHTVGRGVPDLLVGYQGKNILLEVKDGTKPWKLTPEQVGWHRDWKGQVDVATNPDQAVLLVLTHCK